MRHIISLTTIPPRFGMIGPTLASLLAQKARPESIRLHIPHRYRRFPGYDGAAPQVPEGVTVVRVDDDLGPATKVLPAAREFRGQAVEIVYCDDDHHYLPEWSTGLLAARRAHPDCAVAASGRSVESMGSPAYAPKPQPQGLRAPTQTRQVMYQLRRIWDEWPRKGKPAPTLSPTFRAVVRSGYLDTLEGYCGVALRPDFLDDAAFDIPPVLWAVDDIWLSGMLARNGVKIWGQAGAARCRTVLDASDAHALYKSKIEGRRRVEANLACVQHMQKTYGIWGGAG